MFNQFDYYAQTLLLLIMGGCLLACIIQPWFIILCMFGLFLVGVFQSVMAVVRLFQYRQLPPNVQKSFKIFGLYLLVYTIVVTAVFFSPVHDDVKALTLTIPAIPMGFGFYWFISRQLWLHSKH